MTFVLAFGVLSISSGAKTTYNAAFKLNAKVNGTSYASGDTITVSPGASVTVTLTYTNDFYSGGVSTQLFYDSRIFSGATAEFNKNGKLYEPCAGYCTFNDWDKIAAANRQNWWPDYEAGKKASFKENHKFCYMTMTVNPAAASEPPKNINEVLITYTFKVSPSAAAGTSGQIIIPKESIYRKNYMNGRTICVVYKSSDIWSTPVTTIDGLTCDVSKAVLNFKVAGGAKKGDVNSDGAINSTDALWILQSSVGNKTLTDAQKKLADVNSDGKINSSDALMVLQYSVGKITSF